MPGEARAPNWVTFPNDDEIRLVGEFMYRLLPKAMCHFPSNGEM